MKDHRRIDERSLAFGRAIAAHLRARPELVEHARGNIARWLTTCSEATRPALLEWLDALNGPLDGVLSLLTGTEDRARRLRQSNPFAGVLSQQERNAILREFQAHDSATA